MEVPHLDVVGRVVMRLYLKLSDLPGDCHAVLSTKKV